ncbi:MAG: Uma2 family endonuclease [Capsulimonadales bacterium]|nr:Uma2 family endonuclease [Capsulimonadales bacterium]
MTMAAYHTKSIYPDSDGERMADNTLQAEEMIGLKTNLDDLFADREDVFVAMDLLWYPVEGHPEIRVAPDVFVAFGRPKGYRGSYRQFEEEGVAPQVVFEVLSLGNRIGEMLRKRDFYDRYGAEEYYLYDPERFDLTIWQRPSRQESLILIGTPNGWVSPRLGVRFEVPGDRAWTLYRPDGTPFRSPLEIRRELDRVRAERDRLAAERDRLAERLRELGIDPSAL